MAAAVGILGSGLAACSTAPSGGSPAPVIATAPPLPSAVAGSAAALQNDFVAVVAKVRPSVVLIETDSGLGSGVVFDTTGDVVTNDHVVAGATTLQVTGDNGKKLNATLVGEFAQNDLAVVHVDNLGLPPMTFADSSKLQVGDIAIAVGNPLGLQSSVTEGIVSAVGRTVSEQNGVALPDVIQTSAAINPGNSGGALVDLQGSLIGIPTLAAVDQQLGGSAPGIGFAIPSDTVKDIASQLVQYGRVVNSHRAYLGIQAADSFAGGVVITSVAAGGPAATAGLQAQDVIISVAGQPVQTIDDLDTILAPLQPGQKVKVEVTQPSGSNATYTVTLGELPAS
jgi:putative serine protease PepD